MLPVKFQSTQSDVHGKCAVLIPETGTLAKKVWIMITEKDIQKRNRLKNITRKNLNLEH
jgi:hypothetical protein